MSDDITKIVFGDPNDPLAELAVCETRRCQISRRIQILRLTQVFELNRCYIISLCHIVTPLQRHDIGIPGKLLLSLESI